MEPFSIACTTCRARLKVRDESAIGQILSCPKCGSMVMVERPATPLSDSQPIASSSSSLSGILPPASPSTGFVPRRGGASPVADTVSGTYEELDSLFTAPVAKKPAEKSPSAAAPRKAASKAEPAVATNNAAALTGHPVKKTISTTTSSALRLTPASLVSEGTAVPAESVEVAPQVDAEAALPRAWSVPQLLRSRQVMLVAGAGVFGILLAVGFVSLLASWTRPVSEPTVANVGTQVEEKPAIESEKSATPPIVQQNKTPAAPGDLNKPPINDSKNVIPNSNEPNAGVADKPEQPPAFVDKVVPNAPEAKPTVEGLPPPPIDVPPIVENRNPAVGVLPDNDPLAKFAELFTPARPAPEPTPEPQPPKPAAPPSSGDEPAAVHVPRPAPRHVDVAAQLAYKLSEIEFTNTSLVSFLHFMSELSTIPITMDCEAIVAKKLSVTMPVTLKLKGTTVGNTISEAIKPAKLALVQSDGQATISFAPTSEKDYRELTRKIGDLSGSDLERAEEIGRLVADFVAADSWNAPEGNSTWKATADSLIIRHSEAVHYQVAYFCDKLRAARGLTPSNYDLDAMKPNALASRARAKLNKPVTLNFSRPERLTKILDRLGRVAECQIVVDWQAVADAGWNPDGNTTLVVENRPLAEALTGMLTPMDLSFRVIDDNLLQVSTPATIGTKLECEFYTVADLISTGTDARQLVARLQTSIGDQHFREYGGMGLVRFDAPSNCLIVSLPQPQHREVIRLLKEWKTSKPQ